LDRGDLSSFHSFGCIEENTENRKNKQMAKMSSSRLLYAASLVLALLASPASTSPAPHGEEEMSGNMMSMNISFAAVEWSESFDKPNYFNHPEHKFWIWSHIATMIIAWTVVLPAGKLAKSLICSLSVDRV
jgi:Domain of unknown function (DUF2427)